MQLKCHTNKTVCRGRKINQSSKHPRSACACAYLRRVQQRALSEPPSPYLHLQRGAAGHGGSRRLVPAEHSLRSRPVRNDGSERGSSPREVPAAAAADPGSRHRRRLPGELRRPKPSVPLVCRGRSTQGRTLPPFSAVVSFTVLPPATTTSHVVPLESDVALSRIRRPLLATTVVFR